MEWFIKNIDNEKRGFLALLWIAGQFCLRPPSHPQALWEGIEDKLTRYGFTY